MWRVHVHRRGLVLLMAAAACSTTTPAAPPATAPPTSVSASTTTTAPPVTASTVALPEPDPIGWASCGAGLDCGTVAVPVDYRDPARGTIDLALVRRPAGDPARRIGYLLVNPGGPGASGVRRVRRGFEVSEEVGERFDVVGFDPRGVGESDRVGCDGPVDAFRATDLSPDDAGEMGALETAARSVAGACQRSADGRFRFLGTVDVARDVEVIRRALGEPQVSFVGLSYGTLVGQLWADAYPTSVRALVLDGAVDPRATGATSSADQAAAVEAVMSSIDGACAADPSCPLATSGFLGGYDELARRVEAGAGEGQGVGPTGLAHAAFFATYDADTWPRLWAAVADGLEGDLAPVGELADSYRRLVDFAPFAIVSCLDGPHPKGFAAWQRAGDAAAAASPRFGRQLANELLPCAFWPVGEPAPAELDADGAPPILVLSSTGDAATPYDDGVRVAAALADAHLLPVDLAGHVAIGDSACATEAVTRYLVDLFVPAPGARC